MLFCGVMPEETYYRMVVTKVKDFRSAMGVIHSILECKTYGFIRVEPPVVLSHGDTFWPMSMWTRPECFSVDEFMPVYCGDAIVGYVFARDGDPEEGLP